MILATFVLADGGRVGDATSLEQGGFLNLGYIGAGCEHTFNHEFGYCQVDTHTTVWVRPGQSYHEWRGT